MRFRTGWKRGAVLLLGLSLTGLGCLAGEGETDPLLGGQEQGICPPADTSVFASEQDMFPSEQDSALPEKCLETPTSVGVDNGMFLDVTKTFRTCDGQTVSIEELTCGADAILVDIGAGWCDPCKEEAEHLEEEIVNHFAGRNVAVISIITEDANGQPATDGVCQDWATTYGITAPVLTDPGSNSNAWVSGDVQTSLPINIVMDGNFQIRSYLVGGQSSS